MSALFGSLIQLAQHRIRIATAYFMLDNELRGRLGAAAERGVTVEIWNFQPSMLHAKVMTVDGSIANVGSANLNSRSTNCDEEVNLVVLDEAVTATLDQHFDEDLDRSRKIDPSRWARRTMPQRTLERAMAPIRRFF